MEEAIAYTLPWADYEMDYDAHYEFMEKIYIYRLLFHRQFERYPRNQRKFLKLLRHGSLKLCPDMSVIYEVNNANINSN